VRGDESPFDPPRSARDAAWRSGGTVVLWVLITVLALIAWDLFPEHALFILYAYIFVSTILAMRMLAWMLVAGYPAWGWTAFDQALVRRPPPVIRPEGLEDAERAVRFGHRRATDAHTRLLPLIRETADARLMARDGRGIDADPELVRAELGERLWNVIRQRSEPPDRDAPGMPLDELAEILTALEELERR